MKNCVVRLQGEKVIPVGYELTEMGIIPSDWKIEQLGNLCSLKSGLSITSKDIDDSSSYRCFGGNGLRGYTKKYTHDGDFALIGRQGALCGNIQYVSGQFFASEHALVASPTKSVDPKWLSIYLETMNLNQYSESSAQPGLSAEKLRILKLITPNLNEQTAIANVLSNTDALITQLEQLIAKKQAIKTATMQQLLTGRTRLPQFSKHPNGIIKGYKPGELGHIPEDWEEREIGKFAPLQRGFDLPASKRNEGLYPVVYSNGIVNTHNHFQVKGPGVVTGRSGTLGKVHHIECDFWPHNTSLWVTKFINSDPKFVYYIFKYIGFERFASGSGVPTLNRNDAHSFKVAIPSSLKEQIIIATIFSDMDTELEALEQKLAKVRDIKQGMMQQLLTGRIRLPLDHQP
ncbi:restriction endonuclease subunit S [Serratia liquefaciens]|uniref:restriction endonuclease subunit S n=1 Tax=Serratia liquefaciens TaxID=614 RepID=UPI002FF2155B